MTRAERVGEQITRTREKIAELAERLRGLERQKADIENGDILKMIHGFNASKEDIQAFLQSRESETESYANSQQNSFKTNFKEGGNLISED
jgi:flagellar biosynthesis chaperone FliJ